MPSGSESPGDDYFNDLSQQPADRNEGSTQRPRKDSGEPDAGGDNNNVNKQKRIACVVCRKRKLRCDGEKPSCGTCKRLAHDCAYDEVRRKSGPKRGYVKALEARLAQVETLLKDQSGDGTNKDGPKAGSLDFAGSTIPQPGLNMVPEHANILISEGNKPVMEAISRMRNTSSMPNPDTFAGTLGDMSFELEGDDPFPWEMIGLGLEEPLPSQEIIDDLHQIYFEKFHPGAPLIHRPRYLAALNLSPQMRPPISLRYTIWCHAASMTDKYDALHTIFYERARKYLQNDEMRGHGEAIISVANCQAWVLVACYEFKNMYFPRAWLSTARASRLAQMMGLHRVDGEGMDVKQCIPPPRDWTEGEERRRTFWACFASDRYASIGTGWPMTIDERDIVTNLPATEEAFDKSKPQRSMSLEQALTPTGASSLSPFSGVIVLACLFGRNLLHLHRPTPDDNDDDLNGEFWKRHRNMEQILLNTSLALPDHLRLPSGINDPNIIFLNMNIHASAICLHQAAIYKADRNRLPTNISAESKVRCITAAAEIASIMRMISHTDLSAMSPFMPFCLYVAARVFVQYLKSRPSDQQVRSSLEFLLTAMQAIRRRNPLTESFLVQLDVDLEGTGLEGVRNFSRNSSNHLAAATTELVQNDAACVSAAPSSHHTPSRAGGSHGIFAYSRNEPSFSQFTNSTVPNLSAHELSDFSYTMDFESSGRNIARGASQIGMGANSTGSPTMDLPSRQKSPFLQSQGAQQNSPYIQSRNNSPFLPSQQQNPIDLTGGEGDGMDTSPDSHSGTGDHPTPSTEQSQRAPSSRTSTSYSPYQRTDDIIKPSRTQPQAEAFSGSGDVNLFGTHQEFQDFTAQLYQRGASSSTSNARNETHGQPQANPGTDTAGFGGFSDWNLDTSMTQNPQTGYISTGLTPGGPGAGDWSQILENMNGWEGMR